MWLKLPTLKQKPHHNLSTVHKNACLWKKKKKTTNIDIWEIKESIKHKRWLCCCRDWWQRLFIHSHLSIKRKTELIIWWMRLCTLSWYTCIIATLTSCDAQYHDTNRWNLCSHFNLKHHDICHKRCNISTAVQQLHTAYLWHVFP